MTPFIIPTYSVFWFQLFIYFVKKKTEYSEETNFTMKNMQEFHADSLMSDVHPRPQFCKEVMLTGKAKELFQHPLEKAFFSHKTTENTHKSR